MRSGHYLAVMAASSVCAAGVVIGFNLLVDPLGISPVRVAIAGFNEHKPLRARYDRIVKRHDIWQQQPKTIVIGSSRIKQTMDPRVIAETTFAPAYNGALDGLAYFEDVKPVLEDYLEIDKDLRSVFIEVFASSPLTPFVARRPRPGLAQHIADSTSVFFSAGGVSNSVRTISLNFGRKDFAIDSLPKNGYAPRDALATHHFSVRNIFNFIVYHGTMRRGFALPPSAVAAAGEMIASCKVHQVDCRFFLSPMHADALYAFYHLDLWPELERLKRVLAELAPTYDFTRYSDLIDERIGPVVYWPEAFHFSPALGELMAKTMMGLRTPEMPDNFGVVLDPKVIESSLATWRDERDRWIARHPDASERMRRAEHNFREGVSFKDVTAAELAAGNW